MSRIHGLVIQSGLPLPGLPRADAEAADVVLELVDELACPARASSRYRSGTPDDPTSRVEIFDTQDGHTFFRYGDGTTFDVAHLSRPAMIRARIAPGQTLEDLAAYLYGPVLGFILRAWGRLALHASCVRIGDSAVLLAGDSGAGKSTTAAALAARGMPVLSDDLTALTSADDGSALAWPSFNHVRLWPDGERIVLGETGRLERITPSWDKRRFPLGVDSFVAAPCPVSAVLLLAPRSGRSRATIRTLSPARALISLTTLTYANYLLDSAMRATELVQLGALVRETPIYEVSPSSRRNGIGNLCDAIVRVAMAHAPTRA